VKHPLDDDRIREAAASLVGEHDFAAFGGKQAQGNAGTVRRMREVRVLRQAEILRLEFEATAFLPHQVRRTVGALVEVGRGKLSVEEFETLLRRAQPATAGPAAPAHGLCLLAVDYDELRFD
jgi:tRNA pseudouridine38-40 synthase